MQSQTDLTQTKKDPVEKKQVTVTLSIYIFDWEMNYKGKIARTRILDDDDDCMQKLDLQSDSVIKNKIVICIPGWFKYNLAW